MPTKTTIYLLILAFEVLLPILLSLPDLIREELRSFKELFGFIEREIMPGIYELAERELRVRPREPVDIDEWVREGSWVTVIPGFDEPVGLNTFFGMVGASAM